MAGAADPALTRPMRRRMAVARDLATADLSRAAIARKYGVTPAAITAFAGRYSELIADIQADLDNKLAGVWIAQKEQRILEYQAMAEEAEERDGYDGWDAAQRIKAAALRAVADELGQIPNKSTAVVESTVRHELVGVDPDVLT